MSKSLFTKRNLSLKHLRPSPRDASRRTII